MATPKFKSEVPEYGQAALWNVKALPGGTHFICEAHLLRCQKIQRAMHHRIPQEAGDESSDSAENIAVLCTGCHDTLHRIAVIMSSIKAKTKQSPYDIALEYAKSLNEPQMHEVAANLLMFAQLVAQYRVLKADRTIAGADGNVMIEDIPRDFFIAFKQISKEIKRGDGRPIGMSNLATLFVLEATAKHRPELRVAIDDHIHQRIILSNGKKPTRPAQQEEESFDEISL